MVIKIGTNRPIVGPYERNEMVPSVEVANKLTDIFEGILLDDIGKTAESKDKAMLKRFVDIKALDSEDKNALVYVLDSLLRDAKARKVYASQ